MKHGPIFIRYLYMDWIVECPNEFKFHLKISFLARNWTWMRRATRLCHKMKLGPTKALWKDTFRGIEPKTVAIVALLCLTIWYILGHWDIKGWFPSYLSSQKLICFPLFRINFPRFKKVSLAFIKPNQKCQSSGLYVSLLIEDTYKDTFYVTTITISRPR